MDEAVRRKFLFKTKGQVENDESKDYRNMVFTPMRRDKVLFSKEIYQMSPAKLIYHINSYRYKARRSGKKMNIFDSSAIK